MSNHNENTAVFQQKVMDIYNYYYEQNRIGVISALQMDNFKDVNYQPQVAAILDVEELLLVKLNQPLD